MRLFGFKTIMPAIMALLLLTGCVCERRFEQLQTACTQLQARDTADEATIELLQGRLKVTMTDRALFSSGGCPIVVLADGCGEANPVAANDRPAGRGIGGLSSRWSARGTDLGIVPWQPSLT